MHTTQTFIFTKKTKNDFCHESPPLTNTSTNYLDIIAAGRQILRVARVNVITANATTPSHK